MGDPVRIDGDEGRHLVRVLRLGPGDRVELLDGSGRTWRGAIESVQGSAAAVRVEEELPFRQGESALRIELVQALPKAAVIDSILRRATELGIATFQPVQARRSPPGGIGPGRCQRWRRIARESVKQCRRSVVPAVAETVPAVDRFDRPPDGEGWILHPDGEPLRPRLAAAATDSLTVAVGPEGGWDPEEVERATAAGFRPYRLGDRVLRVETASLLFVAVALFLWDFSDDRF